MTYVPPPPHSGDRITARRQRSADEASRSHRAMPAGGAMVRNQSGTSHPTIVEERFWVRVTSVGTGTGAGSYGYQTIRGLPSGGWEDVGGTGTFYEASGFASLAVGTRVEIMREQHSKELRVQLENCP